MSAYEDRLRQIAEEEGVAWPAVRRVIMSEGGLRDPYRRSEAPGEYSLGPLQLNMRRGVGAEALKAGIDASKDWEAAYRYGLRHAKKVGWLGDWMGARKIGIGNREGLGGASASANVAGSLAGAEAPAGDVGGLGRGAIMRAQRELPDDGTGGAAGNTLVGGGGGQYTLQPEKTKPKTWNESLGAGLQEIGKNIQAPSFKPSGMAPVEFTSAQVTPSVYRPQLQPTMVQAGMGGMGGGGDIRQLLAQLMAQRGMG